MTRFVGLDVSQKMTGRCRYPVAGQENLKLEGLGARDRQAIGEWQSTGGAGQKAFRYLA